jgi:hypothetical protein
VDVPDPKNLLKGAGKQVRSLVLEDAATVDKTPVRALITAAVKALPKPIDKNNPTAS